MRGFVTVASHAGVTAAIPDRGERMRVGAALGYVGPVLSRILGYCPGWAGLGADLPGAAMLEWSRWAKSPGYFFDDPTLRATARMARLRTPVLATGPSDDNWASPAQIDALIDHVRLTEVERRTFTPQELEVPHIGHHGLLKRSVAENAWPELVSWLLQRLPQN